MRPCGEEHGFAAQHKLPLGACFNIAVSRVAWVAQSFECPTLGFGSGCGLRVVGSSPVLGSALSGESA